jgi:isopenicillin N synthase-like dioxygenase
MVLVAPVVDLTPWFDGDGADRRRVADAVDLASRTSGFLQVTGHRVDPAVIAGMLRASDAFFALPMADKLALVPPDASVDRGYAAKGSESLTYSLGVARPPDLFEAFNIGPEDVPDDEFHRRERHRFFAPNIWPPTLPDVRDLLVPYHAAVRNLAVELTRVFAAALDLPDDWFLSAVDRSTATMRCVHYERVEGEPPALPDQQRMGAHTDYGIVTVLYADPVPGLEVLGADGQWWGVIAEPGAFIINIGDMLSRWTNDRWRSTMHRVVPPPGDGPARRRSTAFFLEGNYDAQVACIPTCLAPGEEPIYPPITAGEYLIGKLIGPRELRPADLFDHEDDRVANIG